MNGLICSTIYTILFCVPYLMFCVPYLIQIYCFGKYIWHDKLASPVFTLKSRNTDFNELICIFSMLNIRNIQVDSMSTKYDNHVVNIININQMYSYHNSLQCQEYLALTAKRGISFLVDCYLHIGMYVKPPQPY